MTIGEILSIIYLCGIPLIWVGLGFVKENKSDVKLWHLLAGPFSIDEEVIVIALFCLFIWPIALVMILVIFISEVPKGPKVKKWVLPVWKVVKFPLVVLVWILNIKLWPLRMKK